MFDMPFAADLTGGVSLFSNERELEKMIKAKKLPTGLMGACKMHDHEMLLFSGPPEPLTFSELVRGFESYFQIGSGWYLEETEVFRAKDVVLPGTIALSREPAPQFNKNWSTGRDSALEARLSIPTLAEIVWCSVLHRVITGTVLYPGICVRTSTNDSGGQAIGLGNLKNLLMPTRLFNLNSYSNVTVVYSAAHTAYADRFPEAA